MVREQDLKAEKIQITGKNKLSNLALCLMAIFVAQNGSKSIIVT
jgi:hypothetical protein